MSDKVESVVDCPDIARANTRGDGQSLNKEILEKSGSQKCEENGSQRIKGDATDDVAAAAEDDSVAITGLKRKSGEMLPTEDDDECDEEDAEVKKKKKSDVDDDADEKEETAGKDPETGVTKSDSADHCAEGVNV